MLDIDCTGWNLEQYSEPLSEHLRAVLLASARFDVINREDMQNILSEMKFQDTGLINQKTMREGQALGVEKIVRARLSSVDDAAARHSENVPQTATYTISIKVITVRA